MKNSVPCSFAFLLFVSTGAYATQLTGDSADIGSGNSVSTSSGSIAIGASNIVSGSNSSVFGSWNVVPAGAWDSFVIGDNNTVSSNSSVFTYGGDLMMTGHEALSFFIGSENSINRSVTSGAGNIVIGGGNELNDGSNPISGTNDVYNIILGTGNTSSVSQAWIFGEGNIGQERTVTLGRFASPVTNASLIVGNGTGQSARSNALVVSNAGAITIPSGSLILGSESALTSTSAQSVISTHLSANNYLKSNYGSGSVLSGGGLLAIGASSSSTSTNAIAIGTSSTASAAGAIAIGQSAYASDYSAFSAGAYSYAAGRYSVALGGALAMEDYSIAIGGNDEDLYFNVSHEYASTTLGGIGNDAFAWGSYSMGYLSKSYGDNSFVAGYQTRSASAYEVVLGSQNAGAASASLSGPGVATWREEDSLFELGNGTPVVYPFIYYNAITTLKNGQTTLTNKAWKQDPNVVGTTSNADGKALVVEGHAEIKGKTILDGKVVMTQSQGDISMGIYGY